MIIYYNTFAIIPPLSLEIIVLNDYYCNNYLSSEIYNTIAILLAILPAAWYLASSCIVAGCVEEVARLVSCVVVSCVLVAGSGRAGRGS